MPELLRLSGSAFRIRRPLITTNGFVADADPTVVDHLEDLDEVLGKRIFVKGPVAAGAVAAALAAGAPRPKEHLDPADVLAAALTPKRIVGNATWADDSLADRFRDAEGDPDDLTLGEVIEATPALSKLSLAFGELVLDEWTTLAPNTKTVLADAYPNIRDYLVAHAYVTRGLTNVEDVKNFVLSGASGARRVLHYPPLT